MEKKRAPRRTVKSVRKDMIDAVGRVLTKSGYIGLNITAVAKEARVDKNVIYRNFGDFETLLSAYLDEQDYGLQSLKENASRKTKDPKKAIKANLADQFERLYNERELQQLLLWELADEQKLTQITAKKREVLFDLLQSQNKELFEKNNNRLNHIYALLLAGMQYMVLHKDKASFCHKDINIKEDKRELSDAVAWLVDRVFEQES